ncbi:MULTISPECIES: DUF4359 domain-containing protein [Planktothricoides]|uniref:DUF4359 domain-containing protein n=2 Tax=Planktothricoides raciborskii TaxID=132608 RepID=A0AAU8JIT4_9CYAN|nr:MULTISPECIES: DUF4359 domain-containing protein [Planktothricoides]KOR33689.1 hypothetical protein AM228_28360 [Planktothricoides sp. SR001]MBD2547934.1 DUF4359 domain-containing protein [Planktothricoides raciborskii FACHB-1370]MBD2586340.1 DUF4359 domain-containing protein [Planktothricoides raciborskii FACHB-1261]
MKGLKIVASIGAVGGVGLGVAMAIANPSPEAYNNYAAQQMTQYLNNVACEKVPTGKKPCLSLVQSAQPQISQLISQNTERRNFLLFSIYKTTFNLPLLPTYQFETLGALQNFYIYKQEKL